MKVKWVVYLVLIGTILLPAFPFYTGQIYRNEPSVYLPSNSFKVPGTYSDLCRHLADRGVQGFVLLLPDNELPVPGVVSLELGGIPYTGSDPLDRMCSNHFIRLNSHGQNNDFGIIQSLYGYYKRDLPGFIQFIMRQKDIPISAIILRTDSSRRLYPTVASPIYIIENSGVAFEKINDDFFIYTNEAFKSLLSVEVNSESYFLKSLGQDTPLEKIGVSFLPWLPNALMVNFPPEAAEIVFHQAFNPGWLFVPVTGNPSMDSISGLRDLLISYISVLFRDSDPCFLRSEPDELYSNKRYFKNVFKLTDDVRSCHQISTSENIYARGLLVFAPSVHVHLGLVFSLCSIFVLCLLLVRELKR